jgi:hypothetical protein
MPRLVPGWSLSFIKSLKYHHRVHNRLFYLSDSRCPQFRMFPKIHFNNILRSAYVSSYRDFRHGIAYVFQVSSRALPQPVSITPRLNSAVLFLGSELQGNGVNN